MAIPLICRKCNDDPAINEIVEVVFMEIFRGESNQRLELKKYTTDKYHSSCGRETKLEEAALWEIMQKSKRKKRVEHVESLWWILVNAVLLDLLDCGCSEQIHWYYFDPISLSDHDQEGCPESKRWKKSFHCKHGCHSNSSKKDDNYDSHTDNRNHRCNCRICMNSLLRFTDSFAYKVVSFAWPRAAGLKNLEESSEHYDVLSHFCDVDISLICWRGIGRSVLPFSSLWMSKTSTLLERYDDPVLNPLRQTSEVSILEHHRLSILDCFEQNDRMYETGVKRRLYRPSLFHSCFLQITKEVEHYPSKDPMPGPFLQTLNTFYLSSICSILIASVLGKLMTKVYVKDLKNGDASSPKLKYLMKKEVRHYVKEFFLEQEVPSSNFLKESRMKPGSSASNMNKHGDSYNRIDEHDINDFYEIFNHIEIRPVEILAYPATQQPVLEPILNKFSIPESAPSKHDTMAVEFLRLCTMHDYPNTNGPSLLRLAQAGFFYEGNGNELVCFSCDFRKGSWNFNDSPREIHLRMSPNCKFLSQGGDGNVPVPREESTQDLVPLQSAPQVGVVEPDGPRAAYNGSTSNNTAHLASANYSDGQDQSDTTRRTMVVKHPEYASRPARLASYANFPRHMKQHPADMTDAGFYYAGFGDCCRCFHCGIGLRNWDPEDNPWIEHARWSMECPYILKIKGQAFIDLVQEAARAAEMAQDDEDSEAEGASTGNESDSGNKEKSGASNSASGGPAANEIENNVAKTSEATMSKGTSDDSGFGSGSAPVAQPIKAPLRTAAAQSLIHDEKIKPKYVTAAIEDLVKAEGWGAFSKENIRKYLKIHEENRKSATSASNADPSTLKQENKELKDLTICKICLDEKVSIVFLPCGHLVSCPQCAPALTKCPICRKNIKGTVRTNLVEKSTAK